MIYKRRNTINSSDLKAIFITLNIYHRSTHILVIKFRVFRFCVKTGVLLLKCRVALYPRRFCGIFESIIFLIFQSLEVLSVHLTSERK